MSERDEAEASADGPLWGGRFAKPPAPEAEALSKSLRFDVRLAPQDVEASVAHVRALEDAGLLTGDEAAALEKALREVGEDIAAGRFAPHPADEDVHSAMERGVTGRLGDLGAKLHAGRSRNDLVVTDLRLWLLAAGGRIGEGVARLIRALVGQARYHAGTVMPGITHGWLAQAVTLGHHLLAHAWGLLRDLERLDQWAARTSVSPLGAGALATSTLGLDPDASAARLGFATAFENSLDAVSDRDFAQELLADAAIAGTHLSRLSADVIRWTDDSLGWAALDEAYATGSSMMPQKRNPDVAELVRAKAGRLAGHFVALSSVLAGLPLGYHRDLQEDKEPLFDAADTLEAALAALAGCVETLRFDVAALRRAAEDEVLYATDLAEELVKGGVPFREAHRRIGELLKRLDSEGRVLRDLGPEEWLNEGLPDGTSLLDPDRSVRARSMAGGPSPASVLSQADAVEAALAARRSPAG
ncbi:MAG TPA: argininosuccinate lyase [Actinomycetota bacterium]